MAQLQQHDLTTKYSTPDSLVMKVLPDVIAGDVQIAGKQYPSVVALMFLPNSPWLPISCPLNYFQTHCSIPKKFIIDDSSIERTLNGINTLNKVILTVKLLDEDEKRINISELVSSKLLEYFKYDIQRNTIQFKGFDCYALQSLLSNVKYCKENPPFDYRMSNPNPGDVVVLATDEGLPDSIKHWALYLGGDLYLSKFGRSGEGSESLVSVMTLKGMMLLYDCKLSFTATAKLDAAPWDGYDPALS